MKLKRMIAFMFVILVLMAAPGMQASAADASDIGIQPRLSNVYVFTLDFVITPSGFTSVYFDYEAKPAVFESVTAEIYLEKRFLGIFWTRVDIGETDNVWVDVFYDDYGYVDHTLQLEKTGTYRAKFKLTFTGTGTTDDVIEDVIQAKYE